MSKPAVITPDGFREQYISPLFPLDGQGNWFWLIPLEQVAQHMSIPTGLHRPTFAYLILLTQGEIRQRLNLDSFVLTPATLLHVKEGDVTAIDSISPDVQGYFLHFSPELLASVLSEKTQAAYADLPPCIYLDDEQAAWCRSLYALLVAETRLSNSPAVLSALGMGLIQKLIQLSDQSNRSLDRAGQITLRFRQLTRQHNRTIKPVSFFADQLSVSESYLLRCVKQATGRTPKDLIAEMAILNAKALLMNTNLTVSQIAYETGFDDASYFGRLFRKLTDQTPTDYRASVLLEIHQSSGTT